MFTKIENLLLLIENTNSFHHSTTVLNYLYIVFVHYMYYYILDLLLLVRMSYYIIRFTIMYVLDLLDHKLQPNISYHKLLLYFHSYPFNLTIHHHTKRLCNLSTLMYDNLLLSNNTPYFGHNYYCLLLHSIMDNT